jgi:hypothetical protein
MPELGELLHGAAGDPPDLPDVDAILRRARPRVIRRRIAFGVTAVAVALALFAGTSAVLTELGVVHVDAVHPAPAPSPPGETLREGLLEPGTYAGTVGPYDVRIETRDDVWGASVVEPDWLALTFRQYVLHLQVWDSIVPPAAEATRRQEPPADLVAWLVANPRLSTSAPTRVELGGIPATQVDVRVVEPLSPTPRECTARCVVLGRVAGDGELVDVEVGQRARFLVLGPAGRQLVVFYRAPEKELAVLDGAVQELLAGLRLEPSG